MKKIIFSFIAILSIQLVNSQEIFEKKINSEIEEVTVFITGGEVYRTAKVNLKKGRNKLVFTGLSTVLDSKSIQFTGNKKYDLVSVSSEMDYLTFVQANSTIQNIKDSLEIINEDQINLRNEKSAYNQEKKLLEKNNSIKGTQQNLTVEELRSMADFYRKRMMSINKTISEYDSKINKNNTLIYNYNQQLIELNYKETVHSNQAVIIVDSELNQEMNVDLKYIVSNCGWQANYDLQADNTGGKIKINYKAKVYNNTGNDWQNVDLVLSTSNPNLSASAPDLKPWYLNQNSVMADDYSKKGYIVPQNRAYKQYYQNESAPQMSQHIDGITLNGNNGVTQGGKFNPGQRPQVQIANIEVPQLSDEFKIEKQYSIPSDSKPYLVEISKHELAATFSHKAVPKLDKDAFLLANIVGWEKLNLIPGPSNVYYADTYVGQSYMNTRNVEDTLRLSFGRDRQVIVNRKKLEEFSDKKVIGNNKKDTYTFELSVKNNQDMMLNVDVFDQIPISQDSDITVTVDEVSGAEYNEENGILKWQAHIQPGETVSYKISFTIKYPKNKKIEVQKYRTISAPRF
jgi:uncharacterized protein (TIGR02231 family)